MKKLTAHHVNNCIADHDEDGESCMVECNDGCCRFYVGPPKLARRP